MILLWLEEMCNYKRSITPFMIWPWSINWFNLRNRITHSKRSLMRVIGVKIAVRRLNRRHLSALLCHHPTLSLTLRSSVLGHSCWSWRCEFCAVPKETHRTTTSLPCRLQECSPSAFRKPSALIAIIFSPSGVSTKCTSGKPAWR